MNTEEKFYALMIQAEDIQQHAISLQSAAQDAVKTLPEAIREAVRSETKEIITEAAKNASWGILEASREARGAVVVIRKAWLRQCAYLIALGVLVSAVAVVSIWWGTSSLRIEAEELRSTIAALRRNVTEEQKTYQELSGSTWNIKFAKWGDERGIILPKGVKVVRTGEIKDGREAIVIKP